MAKMENYAVQNDEAGCGFIGGIFHLRYCKYWLRKSSVHSLPPTNYNFNDCSPDLAKPSLKNIEPKPATKKPAITNTTHKRNETRSPSDATRSSTSSSSSSGPTQPKPAHGQQQPNDQSQALVRVGRLGGNLKQSKTVSFSTSMNSHRMTKAKSLDYVSTGNNMGNIVRRNSGSYKLDPDVLKCMGNEVYKQGRFQEALSLYDKAIGLGSDKAVYYSNKSAALIGLDRLVEAVEACKQALRLDPFYHKAHHRLATLYLRFGEVEKALDHFEQSGSQFEGEEIEKAQALQNCLRRCDEARKSKEWTTLLNETQSAMVSGANSSHKVYALQAEALLRLQRHQEAYTTYRKGRSLSIGSLPSSIFNLADCTYILVIETELYMTMGRFEEAMAAANGAAKIDPTNKEVIAMVKRARAISLARLRGNSLFKESKFLEAFTLYSEGLELDRSNSVLLCNRAACRSKLGQFEKAVEDCTAALRVQPCYIKARLRRAHCNAQLERWEASIEDYEVLLMRESPGNEEVGRALLEAQVQVKKQRGEDVVPRGMKMTHATELVKVEAP